MATRASQTPVPHVLVYATFPDLQTAEACANAILDKRLAACVNILQGMVSIYSWQGTRHRDQEVVLIAKTQASCSDTLVAEIRGLHRYENPAILILPIQGGSSDFLSWIASETAGRGAP